MQETKRLTILSTATEGAEDLVFAKDPRDGYYKKPCAYRIALGNVNGGLAAATTITLLAGGNPVFINADAMVIDPNETTFVWCVDSPIGLNNINLRLSAAALATMVFQITAIGE